MVLSQVHSIDVALWAIILFLLRRFARSKSMTLARQHYDVRLFRSKISCHLFEAKLI